MIIGINFKNRFISLWNRWLKVEHRKINYGKLVANELSSLCHYDDAAGPEFNKGNYRRFFRHFIYTQVNSPYVLPADLKDSQIHSGFDILFVHEEDGRTDYQHQCRFVLNELKELRVKNVYIDKEVLNNAQLVFSPKNILSKLILFLKIARHFHPFGKSFAHQKFPKTFYLYYKAFIYHDFAIKLHEVFRKDQNIVLLTFSDMKEYCNLVSQIAKMYQVRSATLQHAVYIKNNDASWSQSSINYLNFSSDYFLAWGEAVKLQLKDVPIKRSQFLVAGCNVPGTVRKLAISSQNLPLDRKFGLIMSAEYWRSSNKKMLEIAQKLSVHLGMPYEILFHPSNTVDTYLSSNYSPLAYFQGVKNANDFFRNKTFLLSHTTTLYITSLTHLRKCFRYTDATFIDIGGLDDTFSNFEELLQRISNEEYIINEDSITAINELLSFHLGKETDSYGIVVKQLLKKNPEYEKNPDSNAIYLAEK